MADRLQPLKHSDAIFNLEDAVNLSKKPWGSKIVCTCSAILRKIISRRTLCTNKHTLPALTHTHMNYTHLPLEHIVGFRIVDCHEAIRKPALLIPICTR